MQDRKEGKRPKMSLNYMALAERYYADSPAVVWNRTTGTWMEHAGDCWKLRPGREIGFRASCQYLAGFCNPSSGCVKGFVDFLQAFAPEVATADRGLIPFSNGTLDTRGGNLELRPHRREDYLTYRLPYEWPDGPRDTPKWDELVRRLIGHGPDELNEELCLLAHAGLAMIGDTSLHRCLLFLGPPGGGKTTLLRALNILLGQDRDQCANSNIFTADGDGPKARHECRFWPIVCLDEFPADAIRCESYFKTITAHGSVSSRPMYGDLYTGAWLPKLVMVANEIPVFRDASGAMKRRLLIVQCKPAEANYEIDFVDELRDELPGIAYRCIKYAVSSRGQACYPVSGRMEAVYSEVQQEGDQLHAMVADLCEVGDPGYSIGLQELYLAYRRWVQMSGHRSMSDRELSRRLRAYAPWQIDKYAGHGGMTRLRGIRLREEAPHVDAYGRWSR